MKKYLFGLGAMLVGAGLMFALMHGEVSAGSKPEIPEPFVCSEMTETTADYQIPIYHCTAKNLSCGLASQGAVSCVKTGIL